ncbi:pyridoxamine 5'-phosphate oxidase family protein [Streptomyces nanshensis]|uniref:pyridoxamine 5'-phosphate oxidase family protein n=1 Tax=Streptomyces nanshensis TaxID=518642 RepID=UPI0026B816D5
MAEAEEPRPWVGQDSRTGHEHEHERGSRPEHDRAAPDGAQWRPGSDGERLVQRRLGTSDRAERFYDEQVLDHLNERMREFVQRQEMFFLATADASGECDSTFRAGPAGFLQVLGERTLAYPEYRGNGVHASLGNIEENPHLGILLVDFTRARIGLHINGRAALVEDGQMRALYPELPEDPVPGRRPQLWVHVDVEEAYIHCAKHIPQMQKAPRRTARDWGTDDYKRKGGDFFGTARDARDRAPAEAGGAREHASGTEASGVSGTAGVSQPSGSAEQFGTSETSGASGTSREPVRGAEPSAQAEPAESSTSSEFSAFAPRSSRTSSSSSSLSSSPSYGELLGHIREETQPEPRPETTTATATDAVRETPDSPWQRRRVPEVQAPGLSVPEQRRAPDRQWPETSSRPQQSALYTSFGSEEQTGATAMDGASGALAARGAQSAVDDGLHRAGSDPHAWREEAERALAEAQRRGAENERGTFQGWFG